MCRARAILLVLGMLAVCASAFPCPYTFREAGFILREAAPYRLCLLVKSDTPDQDSLAQWLDDAADELLRESNVQAEVVDVDGDLEEGLAARLDSLELADGPAAVLVPPKGEAQCLAALDPSNLNAKVVRSLVEGVVDSPARRILREHLVADWCVMVMAQGADAEENQKAEANLRGAADDVVGAPTETGEKIERKPFVLVVARDDPRERLLVESLGIASEGPKPRAAIVFGKGRRFGPVLEEGFLERAYVASMLRFLGNNCACTADPRWLNGPVAPMAWPMDLREKVRDQLGFDPDSPAAWMEIQSVQAAVDPEAVEAGETWPGGADPLLGGYKEFVVEGGDGVDAAAGRSPQVASRPTPPATSAVQPRAVDDPAPSLERKTGAAVIAGLGGLILLAALGGAAIFLRRGSSS
ncbi:MAG: hypothetical protein NTW86_26055 [Candidatus Sumerlaeota bacterium]|nr:hypothetical protein [Candidatus Sumerlaeota bacterium]